LATLPAEGTIPLNIHLTDVCANLITAFSSEQQPVSIEHRGQACHALTRHVQPLTLIICEILTNALKYAHPAGVPVRLVVTCESDAQGTLLVSVSDDGVGLPEGFNPMKDGGIGFQVRLGLGSVRGAIAWVRPRVGLVFVGQTRKVRGVEQSSTVGVPGICLKFTCCKLGLQQIVRLPDPGWTRANGSRSGPWRGALRIRHSLPRPLRRDHPHRPACAPFA
jgi:hypothetical protein